MIHVLYIFLYYIIFHSSILIMGAFGLTFKKGKKWVCLLTCFGILSIPVFIVILLDCPYLYGPSASTPLWFFIAHIICIIPLLLWSEGNAFLNWINMFIASFVSYITLEFPIGIAGTVFSKNTTPIFYETELSAFPRVVFFFIISAITVISYFYLRHTIQQFIKRRWLATLVYFAFLIPIFIIGFWDLYPGVFRAHIHLWNGVISIIMFPVTIVILQIISLLVNKNRNAQAILELSAEAEEMLQQYETISEVSKKASFLRHDARNHLSVLTQLSEKLNEKDAKKMDAFLSSSNHILEETKATKVQEYTPYPILNSLFSIKAINAEKEKIQLKYHLSFPESIPLSNSEQVSLFSNLLDNAIEAVQKLPVESRMIDFSVYEKNDHLCILCTNTFLPEENPVKNDFHTTKKDDLTHGIGTQIMKSIIQKHNGLYETHVKQPEKEKAEFKSMNSACSVLEQFIIFQ